jgi:hypothetical protein
MAHPFQHRPGILSGADRAGSAPSPAASVPSRDSRVRTSRRWVRALVVTLALVVGLSTAAVVATQTSWFKNWLRGYIVREANRYLNGQLSIGRLGGNLFFGLELENIALTMDGHPVVTVKDLGVEYNAF